MSAILIDGKKVAADCKRKIAEQVSQYSGRKPGLAVIIVGNDPASRVYVNGKKRDCAECGIESFEYALPEDTTQEELIELVHRLNEDDNVDGILAQLPLPAHLDADDVIYNIRPDKDVDAFHPISVGRITLGKYGFVPCTPYGVMELLNAYNIEVYGKHCVVIGRSNIVGKPMSMLLLHSNATVTIAHSKTSDLGSITRQADILVCAAGKRNLVTADMIKEGAVVIDVSINRNDEGKLCGDVVFDEVSKKASYITPVPGGVGPMTRVMLLQNTMTAYYNHINE